MVLDVASVVCGRVSIISGIVSIVVWCLWLFDVVSVVFGFQQRSDRLSQGSMIYCQKACTWTYVLTPANVWAAKLPLRYL